MHSFECGCAQSPYRTFEEVRRDLSCRDNLVKDYDRLYKAAVRSSEQTTEAFIERTSRSDVDEAMPTTDEPNGTTSKRRGFRWL